MHTANWIRHISKGLIATKQRASFFSREPKSMAKDKDGVAHETKTRVARTRLECNWRVVPFAESKPDGSASKDGARSFHNTLNEGPLITLMNPRIPSAYAWTSWSRACYTRPFTVPCSSFSPSLSSDRLLFEYNACLNNTSFYSVRCYLKIILSQFILYLDRRVILLFSIIECQRFEMYHLKFNWKRKNFILSFRRIPNRYISSLFHIKFTRACLAFTRWK